MIPAAVMMKLATLGLSADHAEAVANMLSAVEAATKIEAGASIEQRRSADRERKARQRHGKSRDITGQDGTGRDTVSPKKETSPEPPKEKYTPSSSGSPREFDQFWSLFPNKVGKRDAEREFALALKRSSFDAIMAGLHRYVAKTDDRPWCNPTTFLHQDRWNDQPADPVPRARSTSPPPAETVGSLSKRQLFEQRQTSDAPDATTGRVVQIESRRLEDSSGSPRSFAISGNLLGRI